MEKTDLITRIKQMASRIDAGHAAEGGSIKLYVPTPKDATLLYEAANEIKRLQAERDLLKSDFDGLWEAYNAKWIFNPPR